MKLNIVENYGELSRLAALQLLAVLAQGCEKKSQCLHYRRGHSRRGI